MDFFSSGIIPDQTLWLICAAFYLMDNARLHAGRELLLTETIHGQWTPTLPLHRYRLRGRVLTLLQPMLPFLAVVPMDWLAEGVSTPLSLRRTKRLLQLHQRRLAPFRLLAVILFLTIFVAGPLATYYVGLGYALVLVLPVHLTTIATLAVLLITGRRAWRMRWSQLASLVFECAVCPGCFVNICRKLSLGYTEVSGDPIALALDQDGADAATRIADRLDLILEDLAEHDELQAEDKQIVAAYRGRLAEAYASG